MPRVGPPAAICSSIVLGFLVLGASLVAGWSGRLPPRRRRGFAAPPPPPSVSGVASSRWVSTVSPARRRPRRRRASYRPGHGHPGACASSGPVDSPSSARPRRASASPDGSGFGWRRPLLARLGLGLGGCVGLRSRARHHRSRSRPPPAAVPPPLPPGRVRGLLGAGARAPVDGADPSALASPPPGAASGRRAVGAFVGRGSLVDGVGVAALGVRRLGHARLDGSAVVGPVGLGGACTVARSGAVWLRRGAGFTASSLGFTCTLPQPELRRVRRWWCCRRCAWARSTFPRLGRGGGFLIHERITPLASREGRVSDGNVCLSAPPVEGMIGGCCVWTRAAGEPARRATCVSHRYVPRSGVRDPEAPGGCRRRSRAASTSVVAPHERSGRPAVTSVSEHTSDPARPWEARRGPGCGAAWPSGISSHPESPTKPTTADSRAEAPTPMLPR